MQLGMFAACAALTSFEDNLSSLVDGSSMFVYCQSLETFNADLRSLTNGSQMFSDCAKLTSFNSNLRSLRNGTDMFKGCILDEISVVHISNTIKDISSLSLADDEGKITINHDPNIPDSVLIECGQRMLSKGWKVIFNELSFGVSLDITVESGYIPDASKWHDRVYPDVESPITSVTNGYAMNASTQLFRVDSPNIVNGSYLMEDNRNLTSWDDSLESLTNGYYMFYYCTNLTSFNSDLSSITGKNNTTGYMFYNCNKLTTFNASLSSLTENNSTMFSSCSNLTTFISDLSSLGDGSYMFRDKNNLTTFNASLRSLTNGSYMFNNCAKLTSFNGDLSSLRNGTDMFKGCILDEASVVHISNTIKDISSLTLADDEGFITINHNTNIPTSILEECGNRMVAKGWDVVFNNLSFGITFDITAENGYIPDASKWHDKVYSALELPITSVTNGYAMNASTQLFRVDSPNIVNGSYLMYGNSKLESWDDSLESLTNGSNMFNGCSKLTSFNSDLNSLTNGKCMF